MWYQVCFWKFPELCGTDKQPLALLRPEPKCFFCQATETRKFQFSFCPKWCEVFKTVLSFFCVYFKVKELKRYPSCFFIFLKKRKVSFPLWTDSVPMWYFLEIFTHLRACLLAIIKAAKPGFLAIMKAAKPWSKTKFKFVCGICVFRKFSKSQKLARKEKRAHWTLSLRRLNFVLYLHPQKFQFIHSYEFTSNLKMKLG